MQDLETRNNAPAEPAVNGQFKAYGGRDSGASPNGNGQAIDAARAELATEIGRLRTWHFWSGPLATAAAIRADVVANDRSVSMMLSRR